MTLKQGCRKDRDFVGADESRSEGQIQFSYIHFKKNPDLNRVFPEYKKALAETNR